MGRLAPTPYVPEPAGGHSHHQERPPPSALAAPQPSIWRGRSTRSPILARCPVAVVRRGPPLPGVAKAVSLTSLRRDGPREQRARSHRSVATAERRRQPRPCRPVRPRRRRRMAFGDLVPGRAISAQLRRDHGAHGRATAPRPARLRRSLLRAQGDTSRWPGGHLLHELRNMRHNTSSSAWSPDRAITRSTRPGRRTATTPVSSGTSHSFPEPWHHPTRGSHREPTKEERMRTHHATVLAA
jgi:hypothetical protein